MTHRIADRETAPEPCARRFRPRASWLLVGVAVIAATLTMSRIVRPSPATIDRVTIVNNTPYDVNVDLAGADRAG